ncbi:hypothetical protein [Facklamia sp. 7083-14-GEN3]|uniref:hypothetical protein n=1 Tax=Facklamia sp. 7083-14-GEN3 TaxID=2973478 RepID=UPI00215D51B6|nr:hypothetical protein [Facklamia sp. 7083-14-GEN3]MCR8968922.1 hypothetical protein [Facklamia sp. 7083-14-GEN3]
MHLIDIGSYAGAIIAVITLISKLIGLITALHNLIERIDWMQAKLEAFNKELLTIKQKVDWHDHYMWQVERCQSL